MRFLGNHRKCRIPQGLFCDDNIPYSYQLNFIFHFENLKSESPYSEYILVNFKNEH